MAAGSDATELRQVAVSAEQADALYKLQRFCIQVEQALVEQMNGSGELPDGEEVLAVEPWSSWADTLGAIVSGHQLAGLAEKRDANVAYVVVTDASRTEMIHAWPHPEGDGWRLEAANRNDSHATWGPPRPAGVFVGSVDEVIAHIQGLGYHGEVERVPKRVTA